MGVYKYLDGGIDMTGSMKKQVQLFMTFDILGDTERTGPLLWHIDRKRLEDVKNHILDLILISRIVRKELPSRIDYDRLTDYIICHDLPEAITGDITKFEGVSDEEINRVTGIAVQFLQNTFGSIMDIQKNIDAFDHSSDLEAKIAKMIDKIHSASTFIKYQSEANVDMDNPDIIPILRNHPVVVEKIAEGKDLADIFYEFHMASVRISDEECRRYHITREEADHIVAVLRSFAEEMYSQKRDGSLFDVYGEFPKEAMKYNRNRS